ncbi:MAG TPA: ribulose-phosphate 3-epimerase, partial [Paludibacteraceae bacterium]|nr:ribulose-phosphate 3-epimerase [Paludibacteraceae bacterium]
GVTLNPHTPVEVLEDIINDVDLVLLMSVNPGFGGQSFIENTYNKIARLKKMIERRGSKALIQVDGGVSTENAAQLYAAGADCLVAGSAVFGSDDIMATIRKMKR